MSHKLFRRHRHRLYLYRNVYSIIFVFITWRCYEFCINLNRWVSLLHSLSLSPPSTNRQNSPIYLHNNNAVYMCARNCIRENQVNVYCTHCCTRISVWHRYRTNGRIDSMCECITRCICKTYNDNSALQTYRATNTIIKIRNVLSITLPYSKYSVQIHSLIA